MGRPQAGGAGEPLGSPAAEAQVMGQGEGGLYVTGDGGGREEADRDVLPFGFLRKAKNHLLLTGMGPKTPPQASGTGRDMCEGTARWPLQCPVQTKRPGSACLEMLSVLLVWVSDPEF